MENQKPVVEPSQNQAPLHQRHFKSFWPIVVIAVISALLGGGLVWAFFNQGLDEELNGLVPGKILVHKKTVSDNKTSNFSEVKDWQTYNQYGVKLMYPQGWEVLDNNSIGKGYFDLSFKNKKYNKSFEWPGLRVTNKIIDNNRISKATKAHIFDLKDNSSEQLDIYFVKDGEQILATCALYIDISVLEQCNQILSTFKFLDQQDSGWQTYTNKEYGFSFEYPNNLKVGDETNAINLGTSQNPVKGISLGAGAVVILKDESLKQKAAAQLEWAKQQASKVPDKTTGLYVECFLRKITNSLIKIQAVNCQGEGGPVYNAYIKGNSYDVYFEIRDIKPEDADKLLSTFKFTEPSVSLDIKTWKTYTNKQYGFQFKYPKELYEKADPYSLFKVQNTSKALVFGEQFNVKGQEGIDYFIDGYSVSVKVKNKKEVDVFNQENGNNITKLNLKNIDAVREDNDSPNSGPSIQINNPKDPSNYVILNLSYSCEDQKICTDNEVESMFNSLLSTFQFIN